MRRWLPVVLSVLLLGAATDGPWWPRWLDFLFGVPKPKAIGMAVTVERSADVFTTKAVVRWTDDGRGPIDTLIVLDSMVGAARQVQKVVNPVSGALLTFSWPNPAAAATANGITMAVLKRRAATSDTAKRAWNYTEPDVPPPTPTIDTTDVELRLAWVNPTNPRNLTLAVNGSSEFCVLYRFQGVRAGSHGNDPTCNALIPLLWPLQGTLTAGEQTWVDNQCVHVSSDAPGHGWQNLRPCWVGAATARRGGRSMVVGSEAP